MPVTELTAADLTDGRADVIKLLVAAGLCSSNGDARRNIQQGGVTVDDRKITDIGETYTEEQLKAGVIVRRGKKNFMCLGNRDMMALKGVRVPEEDLRGASTLYLSIADRYVGSITLGEGINPDSASIVADYRAAGVENCTLITGDGSEASAAFAQSLGVTEFYSQCTGEDKLTAVGQSRSKDGDSVLLFLYGGRMDSHSAADIDACMALQRLGDARIRGERRTLVHHADRTPGVSLPHQKGFPDC